jgi:hypothetical protein
MGEPLLAPASGPALRERRDPDDQAPRTDGRRATDPRLTTRDCADRLSVTPRFIVGEILDGRLIAHGRQQDGRRVLYRISELDFAAYLRRFWPTVVVRRA